MKILFTLEAEIEGKSVKIEVKENLDIFTIAHSIAIQYELGEEAEEEIMIVILETLTSMMDSTDVELKTSICKLLNNTVRKETSKQYSPSQSNSIKQENIAVTKSRGKQVTLYDRALNLQQQKKKMARLVKQVQAEEEVRQCTFQPQINSYPFVQRNNTHEILYKNAKMIKEKKENARKTREDQEVDRLSFKPELNQKSLKLLKNKSHSSFKRMPYHQQYSHQPQISKGSQKIASHFPNFDKRLERYMNLKREAVCEREREKENSFCSKVEKNERDKYKEIFDDQGRDQERRMKLYGLLPTQCKHDQESTLSINSSFVINSRSEELFSKKKSRAFELIFDNVECDGIVNEDSIRDHNLSQEIYLILQPLLSEISELQVSLNKQEFLNSLDRLYGSLGTVQKQVVLNRQTKKKWQEGHQEYRNKYKFRPNISQKSKDLAVKKQLRALRPLEPRRRFQNQEEQQRIIERYMKDNFNSDSESEQSELGSKSQKSRESQGSQQQESRFTIQEEEQEWNQNQSDIQLI